MFKPSGGTTQWMMFVEQLIPLYLVVFVFAIIFSMPVMEKIKASAKSEKSAAIYEFSTYVISMVLLGLCVLSLSSASYNPFIYFRF
jgi:alginate O-acetyltransferase complex protein AlgI